MKNKILIFFVLIVAVFGIIVFIYLNNKTANDMGMNENISKQKLDFLDSKELRDLIALEAAEERFYLLNGYIGKDKQIAYLYIKEDIQTYNEENQNNANSLVLNLVLPDVWNEKSNAKEYISIPLDSKKVSFGKDENDALVLSGVWNAVLNYDIDNADWEKYSIYKNQKFSFKQSFDAPLNNLSFAKTTFNDTKKVKMHDEDEMVDIFYSEVLQKPLVVQNANIKDKLNKVFANNATSVQELKNILENTAKNNFETYKSKFGFKYNTESIENYNVVYIDDKILAFSKINYTYVGGAHGSSTNTMEAYSLVSGEQLSNKINDLFNIDKQDDKQFLELLNLHLQSQKDKLFDDSLPLKVFPNAFFISSKGIIFLWDAYSISPYSSGDINIIVTYDELKKWVNPNSPFAYLF